jgi:hypothetical protein
VEAPVNNLVASSTVVTSTTTTTDETKDWKTYTNTQYGFVFKYPTNLLETNINIVSRSLDEAKIHQYDSMPLIGKLTDVTNQILIDDKLGYEYDLVSSVNYKIHGFMISIDDSHYLEVSENSKQPKLSKNDWTNIISTFKFTTPTDQTADWKTYTNTQYGFEIKYPAEFGNAKISSETVLDCISPVYNEVGLVSFKNIGIGVACPSGVENSLSYKGNGAVTTIAGRQAYNFEYTSAVGYMNKDVYVRLPFSDNYLVITHTFKLDRPADYLELSPSQWNTILSTFKFTNHTAQLLITVNSPNGGETLKAGQNFNITWSSEGLLNTDNIVIRISDLSVGASDEDSKTVAFVKGDLTSYNWTIPTDYKVGSKYKTQLAVVRDEEAIVTTDWSDNYFTIN